MSWVRQRENDDCDDGNFRDEFRQKRVEVRDTFRANENIQTQCSKRQFGRIGIKMVIDGERMFYAAMPSGSQHSLSFTHVWLLDSYS